MRTMHLFAGIGGGLLADLILGHRPILAVEWEPYACQVLRERAAEGWFPDLSVWEGDVRLFDPSAYAGKVDCVHAGFPCQDISVAGKQAGIAEGTRSGLYREVLRVAGVVRPRYIFLENVAAIISKGLDQVVKDLAQMGYDSRWCCIRASDVGAVHSRDRWWCLCTYRDNWESARQLRAQQLENDSCGKRRGRSADDPNKENQIRGKDAPNTMLQGLERQREVPSGTGEELSNSGDSCWWSVESNVGRVANGTSHRVHRLKGLGNAQVPLQAAAAFKILYGD